MTTALIIGDIQRGITGAYPFARQVVPPLTDLLPRARSAGVLVVFVRIAFRVNRADLPPGNALSPSFFEAGDIFHEGAAGTEIDLPVHDEDVVVLKRRASAFAGTDLDSCCVPTPSTIAVAGVATSAMVAATCYDAADGGYRVTVLRDGCADSDPTVHEFFMDKVFPAGRPKSCRVPGGRPARARRNWNQPGRSGPVRSKPWCKPSPRPSPRRGRCRRPRDARTGCRARPARVAGACATAPPAVTWHGGDEVVKIESLRGKVVISQLLGDRASRAWTRIPALVRVAAEYEGRVVLLAIDDNDDFEGLRGSRDGCARIRARSRGTSSMAITE